MIKQNVKNSKKYDISIRCECSIVRDGFKVNTKKKSKISQIAFDSSQNILKVINHLSQKQTEEYEFPLQKLKAIHKKFIDEGKITLQFFSHTESITLKGQDLSADHHTKEVYSQIFIDNASTENLQLFVTNLVQAKKKFSKSVDQQKGQEKKEVKKKPVPKNEEVINRKELMKIIRNEGKPLPKKEVVKKVPEEKKYKIGLMDLPLIALNSIFKYCQLKLEYRLVSKDFGNFILKNILNLKLKDEVDEASFNKLAQWAINVQCRMKNVKSIHLSDKYDFQQLELNRAKTLKFGTWKEMTTKNIDSLKGLRIYGLEIPYLLKFPVSHLNGLRLVELRFKGRNITVKSSYINDDELIYLVNGIKEMRAIQSPYISSKLLTNLKQPERIKELKMGIVNQKNSQEKWTDLTHFTNLITLWIEGIQIQGVTQKDFKNERKIEFPHSLTTLAFGSFICHNPVANLPTGIENLKLMGEQYRNGDFENVYLPNLKVLDISECPYMNPQCLEWFQNIKVFTNWEREKSEHAKSFYRNQMLDIHTYRN